ncbi:MAG: AraC family transcriptional regulator [Bacteroidales bacterium]|jgi:AraC-like DNA-binding protein|nr:AraC family transcriptional regulator [Mariniphaga sp.]NLB93963.1 AraC family transcriptional regulator [Bacteroidales bacterium]
MKQFYKYLTTGPNDMEWGIYLNSAGSLTIPPQTEYPLKSHPSGYYFTWEQGRELQEYQLNYITRGNGIFEDRHGIHHLKPGSLLFIFPGEWHRYKPAFQTGWTENYIGFNGEIAKIFMNHKFFRSDQPVLQVGEREEILDTFLKIFDLVEKEQPGFQQIASGLIVQLLGYLVALDKQKGFSGKKIVAVVEEARFRMRSEVGENFDIEGFAAEQNIGYSYFRRMFKNYTGLSPRQYCLQLKMMRAKELLLSTNLSVKEISYELGFESIHYFSRMFKQKTGKSPVEFRG